MLWVYPQAPPFLLRNVPHIVFLLHLSSSSKFLCKVSYSLCIIIAVLMTGLIILLVKVIVIC